MARYFMHFWSDEHCEAQYRAGFSGMKISHSAGEGFLQAGVRPGDIVYVISVYDGQIMLIGGIPVESIGTSRSEMLLLLGDDIEEAAEYVLPVAGLATEQYFTRQLMMEEAGDLRFRTPDGGSKPLRFAGGDEVDEESLRGVHEITPESASLLDRVLSQPYEELRIGHDAEDEEEEIDNSDLAAISRSFADEDLNRRVQAAAMEFVVSTFEEKGWTVLHVDDPEEGYDLQCTMGNDHLHVVVRGNVNDALEFTLGELEYARAEQDGHFALCLVGAALSHNPFLSTFNGDDLYDLFDARPLRWAFRYRDDDDMLDTEDF
jgi:hypothetical protein